MKQNKAALGYLMILLSAIGFGSYGIWSRYIGAEFGIYFQGWVRSALVLLVIMPIAYFTKSFKPVKRSDLKWLLTPVLFAIFTQVPLYYAYNNADIGTVTLIFYSVFVITSYVVGKIFIGEKIGPAKLVSLLLAFLGLFIMFGLSLTKFSLLALILAAVNGIASGGEVATTKKSSEKFSSLQISVYVWLGILVTHLPMSILTGESQIAFLLSPVWFAMLAFAGAGLISFLLVIEGYKYVDASIGGLIGLMEIISGVIFGILLFQEKITLGIIFGGMLILLAAMLPDLVNIVGNHQKMYKRVKV